MLRLASTLGARRRLASTLAGGFGHTLEETTRPGFYSLTLARPEVHNAFNDDMIHAMTQTLDELSAVEGLRGVFLRGEGKSFCAGGDLQWMRRAAHLSAEEKLAWYKGMKDLAVEYTGDVAVWCVRRGARLRRSAARCTSCSLPTFLAGRGSGRRGAGPG